MNIGEVVEGEELVYVGELVDLDVEELNYQCCLKLSMLYALTQIPDFYFAYQYYGSPDIIVFNITISFWFFINGIIGLQYSLFLILYQLTRNTYRSHFIFTFGLILTLALAWSIIGYVGFFKSVISIYFMFKLVPQTIIYVFTIGAYLNN